MDTACVDNKGLKGYEQDGVILTLEIISVD